MPPKKKTKPEVSSLRLRKIAAKYLHADLSLLGPLGHDIKALAGSVLTQSPPAKRKR